MELKTTIHYPLPTIHYPPFRILTILSPSTTSPLDSIVYRQY